MLCIETDYFSGSVGVDWPQADKVESKATFQITLNNGKRLIGTISKVEAGAAPDKDFKVHAQGVLVRARADRGRRHPHSAGSRL